MTDQASPDATPDDSQVSGELTPESPSASGEWLAPDDSPAPDAWPRLVVSSASDRGRVRKVNEDSLVVSHPVYAVADGMGGHALGDEASQRAVAALSEIAGTDATPATVLAAITNANRAVAGLSANGKATGVAGTTLSGVAMVRAGVPAAHHWMAFNIGDSRVYSWDGRDLRQVTVDHSAVQELVEAGVISPDEATAHPERNVITRALGVADEVDADVWLIPARGSQTFVICSDGLSKELADGQIARALAEHSPGETTIAQSLVQLALDGGGNDNVTVVVVEAESAGRRSVSDSTVDALRALEQTLPRN